MLKKISPLISPELMNVLMRMGHGDEIVLGDGNFPGETNAARMVRADGIKIPELLAAILELMPLDTYVEQPVALMRNNPDDPVPAIYETYKKVIEESDEADKCAKGFEFIERYAFYDRTRSAFAVVATSETSPYANVILKKGFVEK